MVKSKIGRWIVELLLFIEDVLRVIMKSSYFLKTPLFPEKKKKILILGNGPSLNNSLKQVKSTLNEMDLFCVNNFSTSEQFTSLRPVFYVLLDPYYFNDNKEEPEPGVRDLINKTSWKLNLFVPKVFMKSNAVKLLIANKNIVIHPFNYVIIEGDNRLSTLMIKNGLGMIKCQTVLIAALFLSMKIGYRSIGLLGADHTFHQDIFINEDNQMYSHQNHFYQEEEGRKILPIRDANTGESTKMIDFAWTMVHLYNGYQKLKTMADRNGASITNHTKGSFIDVFPRGEL